MCELLGMSANVPTDICFSLTGLVQRGGKTGPHKDGWGIAFYEGKGLRIFHDPSPGVESKIAAFVQKLPIKSEIVISHIRKANHGKVDLKNTHPFVREFWGFHWTFAHNGQFKKIKEKSLGDFQPVGSTDSEYAFCWLLGKLKKKFKNPPKKEAELFKAVESLMWELHQKGVSNILFSDSRNLYTFCSTKLSWITRKSPFGKARLVDADLSVDFRKVTTPGDRVTVIATRPLTSNEEWMICQPGEFSVWRKGQIVFSNR
ncbi:MULTISPECIES: class II glutamine amidotransferase [Leptospira]|uniref:Glutamine amidotransferases class-II n=1 Tax=Leptospira alexanderi serovar Manhao 3 str. L 60 TaxID=1049759 RepID=V6HWY9_9LEPT|nr:MULTISPECIES: class II glutamine amidotransferase [Leptospira]EQA61527.1 glutamine amidotransferases class-II [Leptospira alexanderi serovar Manhao 3 str. L 60]